MHTCPTLGGGATFLVRAGVAVRATFLICTGGGVRTIGSAESSPGRLCSPVTSSSISVSLSGVYGWCQHKRQNKSKVRTVSSLLLFRAPPASSQRSLLCSHLGRRPLDEVRIASPYHGAWKQVEPLQRPLLASSGCELRSGRRLPGGSPHLESGRRARPRTASLSRYPGPVID